MKNKDLEEIQTQMLTMMSAIAVLTKATLNLNDNGMKIINKRQEDFLIDALLSFEDYIQKLRKGEEKE